jgi:hypothetical protein
VEKCTLNCAPTFVAYGGFYTYWYSISLLRLVTCLHALLDHVRWLAQHSLAYCAHALLFKMPIVPKRLRVRPVLIPDFSLRMTFRNHNSWRYKLRSQDICVLHPSKLSFNRLTSRRALFLNNWLADGSEVVSLTSWQPFSPGKIPGIHFCWGLSRPHRHYTAGMIMSVEKSNDIFGNQGNFPACGTVPQPCYLVTYTCTLTARNPSFKHT